MFLSAVVGAEKSLEYTKRILILSPMYMIVAIIGWVKNSNSVTRDPLNVINAIDFTNANLQMQFLHTPQEIQRVHQWINAVTRGIQADYPFYATTLPCVANILFQQNEMGAIFLNPAAFGELVVIVRHIEAEPVVVQFWAEIHPRIVNVSRELYADGHCRPQQKRRPKK